MKRVFGLFACLFLLLPGLLVHADSLTLNGQIQTTPIEITKNTDMSITLYRQAGTTDYTDSSPGWVLNSAATFTVSGEQNKNVTVTVPSTVNLANGGESASVSVVCRASTSAIPTSKTDGTDCTNLTLSGTGYLYLGIFPTGASFSSDKTGAYTGTLMISVDYL